MCTNVISDDGIFSFRRFIYLLIRSLITKIFMVPIDKLFYATIKQRATDFFIVRRKSPSACNDGHQCSPSTNSMVAPN